MGLDVKLDNSSPLFINMSAAAFNIGKYSFQIDQLAEDLGVVYKSDKKSHLLFIEAIKNLKKHLNIIEKLKVSSVQLYVNQFDALFSQAKVIEGELNKLQDKLHRIFHQMFEQTFEICFKKVFERDSLNRFRSMPTLNHLKEAEAEHESSKCDFFHVVHLKKIAEEYKIKLSDDESRNVLELYKRIEVFEKFLDKKDRLNIVSLLNRLALISNEPSVHAEEEKAQLQSDFNCCLQRFAQEFQDELDWNVYVLSPEPKRTEEWEKHHRYDSLTIFKQALAKTFQNHFEALWKKKQPKDSAVHIDSFYTLLHEIALGPKSENPVNWVKEELPSLLWLIETISLRDLEEVEKYRSK